MKKTILVFMLIFFICQLGYGQDLLKPISHGSRDHKLITLTFDDGPHPEYTDKILKILNKFKIKATFFIVGKSVMDNPHILKKIIEKGHDLGNHTYSHKRLDTLSEKQVIEEITVTNYLVKEISNKALKYFRPPGGRYNKIVIESAKKENLKIILWDVNAGDYWKIIPPEYRSEYPYADTSCQKSARRIIYEVINNVQNGSIILFHNTNGETLKALPKIIKKLRKKGYKFVGLGELIPHPSAPSPTLGEGEKDLRSTMGFNPLLDK